MSLEKDISNIKIFVEKDELFKAASEENLSNREEEVAKNKLAYINTLPKARLFALISDQIDTQIEEEPGKFRYDVEEDKYYDETGKEWTRAGLESEYREDHLSFGQNVTIVGRSWLENFARDIYNVINHAGTP